MYEEIKEKFKFCNIENSYKRINATHPLNIYIGLSGENNKSLAIITSGELEEIESSKLIKVSLFKRDNNDITITFDLLDDAMKDLFYRFCADIIESLANVTNQDIIKFIAQRWKNWISLFKNPINDVLSEIEVKGLLGELIFLNDFMFKNYGFENSLNAWMGPSLAHKDFEINDTWYEIKTINQNSITVKISSLEQLDSTYDGNLVIITLERSNEEVASSITLNSYVDRIKSIIPSNLLPLINCKLGLAKYKYEKIYDQYVYSLKNICQYKVNERFPKISKNNLPLEIVRVNYEILLESIEKFKIGE